MHFRIITTLILSTSLLVGCEKTNLQFGQPNETPVMHDDLGNVRENMQLEPLAPISQDSSVLETPATPPANKIAQPKRTSPKVKPNELAITNAPTTHNLPTVNNAPPPSTATTNLSTNIQNTWQPNEGILIRSNELLFGLQKELGKKPSVAEMQKRLQTHMGLTAAQAQTVITELGLI